MDYADVSKLAASGTAPATIAAIDRTAMTVTLRDRDPRHNGVLNSLADLKGTVPDPALAALEQGFYTSDFGIRNVDIVGPQVGKQLQTQAKLAILYSLIGMLVYLSVRFEWIYGVAAVVACFHDTLITLGAFSLTGKEISLTVIAAILTLVGYSMNDTIVVFDRIKEVRGKSQVLTAQMINDSVNQTLSRTILTSGLTFLAVLSLYLFGGEVIHGFAFALVVGVIIGTYSSIAIASPVLVFWQRRLGGGPVGSNPKPKVLEGEAAGARR